MSFATNASAFGMKPATTSIFGTPTQQPQQQSSLFGGTPAQGQTQLQQGNNIFGSFGQNTQQNQGQQQTGGLFGQQPQQQQPATNIFGQPQQQQQTGSLFGQPQQQQTQPTGGLFGQPQQQQQQPAAGTGLFGQPQQQQTTSLFGQPQQQPTASLFGQPQQQQQTTGGLFGQPQQQQQQPAIGLFGQPQQQQTQPQTSNIFGGSLFGNTAQPQQQTAGPLVAQSTLPASAFGNTGGLGGLGGSTLFGTKSQAPAQQQPLVGFNNQAQQSSNLINPFQNNSTGVPPFTKTTKFNDLPEDTQKKLEAIESFIQGRLQICKDLQQRKLGDEPTKGNEAIRQLKTDLINTATTIRNDLHITKDLKAKVDQAVEDTIVATRIIDGFKNPQSGNTFLKDHATFPLEYFTRVTDQMKERLTWYKSTIEQIERKLASASGSTQTPQGISATLQAQHSTFLALASKTAAVDAELQKIKSLYTQLWRSKTGSVRDPFNDVVKSNDTGNDFGLSGLNVR